MVKVYISLCEWLGSNSMQLEDTSLTKQLYNNIKLL